MNPSEAHLALHRKISDVLLSCYEDPTADDAEGTEVLADLILDALDVQVQAADDMTATCTIRLD